MYSDTIQENFLPANFAAFVFEWRTFSITTVTATVNCVVYRVDPKYRTPDI